MEYSLENVVKCIQQAYSHYGRAFTMNEYNSFAKEHNLITKSKIDYELKITWKEVINLAKVPEVLPGYGSYQRITMNDAMKYIKEVYDALGKMPSYKEYFSYSKENKLPSPERLVRNLKKSWKELKYFFENEFIK